MLNVKPTRVTWRKQQFEITADGQPLTTLDFVDSSADWYSFALDGSRYRIRKRGLSRPIFTLSDQDSAVATLDHVSGRKWTVSSNGETYAFRIGRSGTIWSDGPVAQLVDGDEVLGVMRPGEAELPSLPLLLQVFVLSVTAITYWGLE